MNESDQAGSASGDGQARYRIGTVARLTDLNPHTIRVWERRYGALAPQRTPGGDRLYDDSHVERLILLRRLTALGHAISAIARLPRESLQDMLSREANHVVQDTTPEPQRLVEQMLEGIVALDPVLVDRRLSQAAMLLSPRQIVLDVLVPLLRAVGDRWQAGNLTIAQEHMTSQLVRNQLALLMRLHANTGGARQAVATTPTGELHELGALLAALICALNGWRVLYLGPNLPAEEIARAVLSAKAELVLLSWIGTEGVDAREQITLLRATLPETVRMIAGGAGARRWRSPPAGIDIMAGLTELEQALSIPGQAQR